MTSKKKDSEEQTEKAEKVETVEETTSENSKAEESNTQAKTEQTEDRVYEGEAEVVGTEDISGEEKNWAMFSHIAAFAAVIPLMPAIGMVLGPLVIWLMKKDSMNLVSENGKEALNFNITMFIAYCISFILMIVLIGIPIFFGLVIFHFVITIIAAIKASEGGVYRYPFGLKLIQ